MPFAIRRASMEDYESIAAIIEEADAIHYAAEPDYFRPSSQTRRTRAYLEQMLSSVDSAVFVAVENKRVVGVLLLVIRSTPEASILQHRQYVVIDTIAVQESWRSMGIGHALLDMAETWTREKDLHHLELSVWEFNQRALALYEKTGYRTIRRYMSKVI